MSLNDTPRAARLHIGIFGRRNSGKSSLINALTGQEIALVSDKAGTTTDPVYKSMELHPIGPVVFIDTAGFDDEGDLGMKRVALTKKVIAKTDVALLLFEEGELDNERMWLTMLEEADVPVIPVVNKSDAIDRDLLCDKVHMVFGKVPYLVSAKSGDGVEYLKKAIAEAVPEGYRRDIVMGKLADSGDTVLLVMPQDIQAPKGRLILPQVQTIRELLDGKCTVVCTTADGFGKALGTLADKPDLIITDSQCFEQVNNERPKGSRLTSFSVLFAAYKGDIDEFVKGAEAIGSLNKDSRVLIAEACTHAPLSEDIGREKIPAMLRKKYGKEMKIDVVAGSDFPKKPGRYDLIIHCGACMFNRKHVMSRIEAARAAGVPITNYGVTIAYLKGILDKIDLPE
ncbi:MAG: [FeFe] hydrogenase H-cluster maturation GTPase HydF [Eubacteriaceae bacterium]|nr:[FeFe] hydrogenase H-cluster maturation GTPase HydF [Eubacteriaceae bacterium]